MNKYMRNESIKLLAKYHNQVIRLKKRGGLHFNGCENRSKSLKRDLKKVGYICDLLLINSKSGFLTHEADYYWNYHYVVHTPQTNMVYDASYSKVKPVILSEYHKLYEENDLIYFKKAMGKFIPLKLK